MHWPYFRNTGIGLVLSQIQDAGGEQNTTLLLNTTEKAEKNYCVYKKGVFCHREIGGPLP